MSVAAVDVLPRVAAPLDECRPAKKSDDLRWLAPLPRTHADTIRDAILTLATLGLYGCWTRTRLRQRLWGGVQIDGRPLAYAGTARELWMPIVIALLGVMAIIGAALLARWLFGPIPKPKAALLRSPWRFAFTVPMLIFVSMAAWRAREFLMQRSSWSGSRGSLESGLVRYALRHFASTVMLALTAGWALPWRAVRLHCELMQGARLAGREITVEARVGDLYRWFLLPWLGAIGAYLATVMALAILHGAKILAAVEASTIPAFTAGEWASVAGILACGIGSFALLAAPYQAARLSHLASITRFGGRPLVLDLPAATYTVVALECVAIRVLSLGLLGHIADERKWACILSRLSLGNPTGNTPASEPSGSNAPEPA